MPGNNYRQLEWVSYLIGKRESRRLVGDQYFTLHEPIGPETKYLPMQRNCDPRKSMSLQTVLEVMKKPDFISEHCFIKLHNIISISDSLYSKNLNNLFMARQNIQRTTHAGLGRPTPVMRTTANGGGPWACARSVKRIEMSNP